VLRDAGLLAADRRATSVWYRIQPAYRGAVNALLDRFAPAAIDVVETPHLTGLKNVEPALDRMAASLAARFPGTPHSECVRVVRESYAAQVRRGGEAAHLVPLTEHFARQRIIDAEKSHACGGRARTATEPDEP
jgi:arsenate reductase